MNVIHYETVLKTFGLYLTLRGGGGGECSTSANDTFANTYEQKIEMLYHIKLFKLKLYLKVRCNNN